MNLNNDSALQSSPRQPFSNLDSFNVPRLNIHSFSPSTQMTRFVTSPSEHNFLNINSTVVRSPQRASDFKLMSSHSIVKQVTQMKDDTPSQIGLSSHRKAPLVHKRMQSASHTYRNKNLNRISTNFQRKSNEDFNIKKQFIQINQPTFS